MSKDILDDNFQKAKFVFYMQISQAAVTPCAKLLEEHNIAYQLHPIHIKKEIIFDMIRGFDINNIRADDAALNLFVIEHQHNQLEELIAKNPTFSFMNEEAERKLFFQEAYDSAALLEILAMPDDWEESDLILIKTVLDEQQIVVDDQSLTIARQRAVKKVSTGRNWVQITAISLLMIVTIMYIFIFGISF